MCNGNPQVSRKLDYSARDAWVKRQELLNKKKDDLDLEKKEVKSL